MRKLKRQEIVLPILLAVGIVVLGLRYYRDEPGRIAAVEKSKAEAASPIPRIDLARLDAPRGTGQAGRRNLFGFGVVPEPARPAPPVVVPPPVVAPPVVAGGGGPSTPGLPPLNVKYVGSVENAKGVKVAVLVTDRREVLTGQAGQVVANRYRIARIGLESVDVEDVNTGQSRRIPLRGD